MWQEMYESMKSKVEKVVESGGVHLDQVMKSELRDAISKWTTNFTRQHHPSVIQVCLGAMIKERDIMLSCVYFNH